MKRNVNRILAATAAAAVLAGVALWASSQFGSLQFGSSKPAPASVVAGSSGMINSSNYVSASVAEHERQATLTLHITAGWHVNANPASLEYLIPTTLSIEGDGSPQEAKAVYPPGKDSGVVLEGKHIQVYEDGTVIPFSLPPSLPMHRIVVHVQACSTQGICLPPANIVASVNRT
ncbi:disulfide bond formation protein DsbD [Trinickia dabaoshanensis]|uniref:Disulfide bond formation protein DsbD n=1 Tax=Trinickia dabaoshanensis TaxID=564714 RepID=A0A2N7VRC6_9BURK|nr:protein-disulfide reductase DsbD domain-containing protein [Trinickia dabaoshanensis]PMS19711.1 disulfide bond formation protein DsbD [Trinickia dabaoshanensis]TAM50927.1 MAG: disulfide bond formation protein DsbD [Paraburkholderia sp.]